MGGVDLIWPDFCSALIVGRLAPLGLHNTRFRSVPVSCSPRTGADASSPRHETHRNVADSRSLESWKGLRRQTSSVLYAPSALSAMALSYESPTVPVEGSMPNSPILVVYTRLMYCAPWSELNRHRFNSDMGWQYQHRWWRDELERLGIRRSMSRRQRRHRAGLRPLEGRVLPRPRVRLVRAVQARAGCVHHPLGHQTAPDTTRGTHPGGVPEHVPRGLGLYPN